MDSRSIAAIDASGVAIAHATGHTTEHIAPAPFPTLGAVAGWAKSLDIRAVWLLEGHGAHSDRIEWWQVDKPGHPRLSSPQGNSIPSVGRVKEHFKARRGDIIVYDLAPRISGAYRLRDTRWPWHSLTDPAALLGAVQAAEKAFGEPLGVSPGAMGAALMQRLTLGHDDWLSYDVPADVPAVWATAPQWCAWPRDLGEVYSWHLHLYDGNAAYLAAAQSTSLGCGALVQDTTDPGQYPGIYLIDDTNLTGPVITRAGWHDAATVRAAMLMGQNFPGIYHAWVWQSAHQTLRKWADHLWQCRQRSEGLARAAVKESYVAALGRLASSQARDADSAWYRPLWHAAIIAEAGRRQWATVARLQRAGYHPVMLDVDTVGYVSPGAEPSALTNAPDSLGKYKKDGSFALDPAVIGYLRDGDLLAVKEWIKRRNEEGTRDATRSEPPARQSTLEDIPPAIA